MQETYTNMETTKTLRQRFEKQFLESSHCHDRECMYNWGSRCFHWIEKDMLEFIEQEIKLAEERGRPKDLYLISNDFEERHRLLEEWRQEGRQEMKKECLECVPEISQSVIDTYDQYTRDDSRIIGGMEAQNEIRTAIQSLK